MKTQLRFFIPFIALVCASFYTHAFNYYITFTGSGESTTLDSVIVQNLYKSTQVTVPVGYELWLYDVETSIDRLNTIADFACVYPNPLIDKATFLFVAKNDGNTQIAVYGIDGRKVAGLHADLLQGKNSFQLNLPKGVYLVQAKGNDFSYSTKVFSLSMNDCYPMISFIGNTGNPQKVSNPLVRVVKLQYTPGDQLLYKGYSGSYCTIVTDKPTDSKTTDFKFVDCTDADGNHYAVVHIGNQTWMAESLKTTKFYDLTDISEVNDNNLWTNLTTPALCWYNNDAASYKNIYGGLYNWYAVNTEKLAPIGWHVPTVAEWNTLQNYLIANRYNYDGLTTGNKTAKSLAATEYWGTHDGTGTIGNNLTRNNASGFSALPGGGRGTAGAFFELGRGGVWWTASNTTGNFAEGRGLYSSFSGLDQGADNMSTGMSVRCVKNISP